MWYLTDQGIIDKTLKPVSTPFQKSLTYRGAVNSNQGKIAIIVDRSQVWTYDLATAEWECLVESDLELNCLLWVNQSLLVGTEKARLAWVRNDGLQFIPEFDTIEERSSWSTPWGGPPNIRSLALSRDGIICVNIHVGWIVTSSDEGKTWKTRKEGLHKDVHQVATHPERVGTIACATAGGFHISYDGGQSFEKRWTGSKTYQRTVAWFDADDTSSKTLLASVSQGPSGSGSALYRSDTDGESWERIEGLGPIDDNINTYQITMGAAGRVWVILNNSQIVLSTDNGRNWSEIANLPAKVYQILKIKE